ncbi:unnamed protein product [Mytilus coruscus]|uniref:CCHC-type domain-containing protein n=1 Tax=Mytilus coruscus TaxID=42192 RepID=A0A6J8D5X8_MYTCO|nr:unnamed protein product [Mytilus coruscus]
MSSPGIDFSSAEINNTAESTFLYQNEDDFDNTILTPDFLEFNEFKEHDIFLSLPTPRKSSTLKLHSTNLDSSLPKSSNSFAKMDKLANCSTFSGYSQDNAKKFLSEFKSYALLHDLRDFDGGKVAAFHLHLKGPALTWFNTLSERSKESWNAIEVLFEEKFTNFKNHSAMAMMEGQIFNTLKLGKSQQLEDFHSQILEKGNLLHKPDHEVLARFIEGLPEKMAFFVRAGQPSDLSAALTSAKMAETCGYREMIFENAVSSSPTEQSEISNLKSQISSLTSAINQISTSKHDDVNNSTSQPTKHDSEVKNSSEFASLTNEVAKLSKNVSELLISKAPQTSSNSQYESPQNNFQRRQQYQYPNTNSNCFNCNFPGHRKRDCNWNGFGQTTSNTCQICHQTGHTAFRCKSFKPNQENYQYPTDTRPNRSGP